MLVEQEPRRALGPALAWAEGAGAGDLQVLVSDRDAAAVLARRANLFAPSPSVWLAEFGAGELHPVSPAPPVAHLRLDPRAEPFVAVLERAGAVATVEHGRLVGEVLGLEVARVVVDDAGCPRLEVGVGKHDRHAQSLMAADQPTDLTLARAVATVREVRRVGVPRHPLNQLAPERWLRSLLVEDPGLLQLDAEGETPIRGLTPVSPPVDRDDLRLPTPAPAAGEDHDGRPVLVVCSTGNDLDAVPAAADAWLSDPRRAPRPRLVLVVPRRDAHPWLRRAVGALAPELGARLATVPDDWRGRGRASVP